MDNKKLKDKKCKCGRDFASKDGVVTYYESKKGGWHCIKCQEDGK